MHDEHDVNEVIEVDEIPPHLEVEVDFVEIEQQELQVDEGADDYEYKVVYLELINAMLDDEVDEVDIMSEVVDDMDVMVDETEERVVIEQVVLYVDALLLHLVVDDDEDDGTVVVIKKDVPELDANEFYLLDTLHLVDTICSEDVNILAETTQFIVSLQMET